MRRVGLAGGEELEGFGAVGGEVAAFLEPGGEVVGCGGGGGVPFEGAGVAVEEVGDEDAVVGGGEDVGALEGLGVEAEDVGDDEDAGFGGGGAGDVWFGRDYVSWGILVGDGRKAGVWTNRSRRRQWFDRRLGVYTPSLRRLGELCSRAWSAAKPAALVQQALVW